MMTDDGYDDDGAAAAADDDVDDDDDDDDGGHRGHQVLFHPAPPTTGGSLGINITTILIKSMLFIFKTTCTAAWTTAATMGLLIPNKRKGLTTLTLLPKKLTAT